MTHHRATYRSNPPYYSPVMNRPYTYQAASTSSQVPLSTDVPDLYYEQGYRTPSSVSSSDMLSTPPRHLTPWMQEYHNDVRESNASYMSSWQSSPMNSYQSKRPTVAPINTNVNWDMATASSPMVFTSNGEFNRAHRVAEEHSSSYPHCAFGDNDQTMSFNLPDSSALSTFLLPPITPSSPVPSPPSDPYTITPRSYPPAATTNQAPLKLHQPRPSRRIPIISLSNLASACDDFVVANHVKEHKHIASDESRPPLSSDFNSVPPTLSLPAVNGGNTQHLKYMLYPTSDMYSPTFGVGFDGHFGKAILCNCGCRESYTFR